MANKEYTERQQKVINGEIPIESLNGHFLRWFLPKSIANNDDELTRKIEEQIKLRKAEAYERLKQRTKERRTKINHNLEIQWKQPKSNEYTEHQRRVVKGEIPLEDVHTNELVHIHLKAHNNYDYELSERILDIIKTRRLESKNQLNRRKDMRKRSISLAKQFDALADGDAGFPLTNLDKAALIDGGEWIEYNEEHWKCILNKAKAQKNDVLISIIEAFMLYKKDPTFFLAVQNHQEAIDLIEELFQLPIRRPNTWFC